MGCLGRILRPIPKDATFWYPNVCKIKENSSVRGIEYLTCEGLKVFFLNTKNGRMAEEVRSRVLEL